MTIAPQHVTGVTTHSRRGPVQHSFRYGVDYVLIDPDAPSSGPALFSRNRFNLAAVFDCDHGGPLTDQRGANWARHFFTSAGLPMNDLALRLLTQPRFLGYVFNPVSFWFAMHGDNLIAVIAEVSTPFGDRHSYLCHNPGFTPITASSQITAQKALHVSPFQDVAGGYAFTFDIRADQIAIRILFRNGPDGLVATLTGPRSALTNAGLLRASLRRPLGAIRTIALIYWQALRLKLKGATYRPHPTPPKTEVTKCSS